MGTIKKGILGGFSGKVGTVIGTNWRGMDVMRSLPKKSGTHSGLSVSLVPKTANQNTIINLISSKQKVQHTFYNMLNLKIL